MRRKRKEERKKETKRKKRHDQYENTWRRQLKDRKITFKRRIEMIIEGRTGPFVWDMSIRLGVGSRFVISVGAGIHVGAFVRVAGE